MRNLPILYKPTETEFGHMGEGVLRDAISCIVTENQNGEYELELKYPINGIKSELLNYDMIIKAKANEEFDSQLFRIYSIRQDLNHNKVIRARHIFYDLLDNFIEKLSLNNTTCTQAGIALLNACTYPTPFTFEVSDITHTGNFNIERVNPVQAIAGVGGSMVDTFGNGATIIRNNFKIGVKQNKAPISDVLIAYRKNLTGFERTVDTSNVATKIYPFAIVESQNGEESTKTVITLTEKYISNPYVDNYANPKIIPYDFSGNDVTTEDQLRAKARAYFTDDRGLPDINYEISFVPLNKTVEYSNFQLLETVTIGTDITVFDERFNLRISTKVIKTVYDSLAGRYTSIELGKQKTNLAIDKIESEQKLEDKINNSNSSIENMNKLLINAIKNATDQITGADGGYVRLNPKDDPQEILIMDHPDINQAKNIWRFNKNGLGHSSTGYNGEYGLAMTADGQIVADKITTGSLNAGLIKAGILMSANRSTWINMDTGTFNFGDKITFDGTNLTIRLQDGKTVEEGISAVNNKIDGLQIGGRNLILNSKTILLNGSDNSNQNCSVIENDYVKITPKYNGNVYNTSAVATSVTRLQGETYTLSFEILTPTTIGFYFYPSEHYTKSKYIVANSKWQKVSFTYTQTGADSSSKKLFGFLQLVAGQTYYYRNLKLEVGNKSTDWSPAPEDVNSAINGVDTKITTTNNKIAEIETSLNGINLKVQSTEQTVSSHTTQLGQVDTKINTAKTEAINSASNDATSKANNAQTNAVNSAKSYTDGQITTVNKTITDKVAEIKLTTDSITQRVSKTESTISSHTTELGKVDNKINTAINNMQVGGRNILRQSGNFGSSLPSSSYWTSNGGGISLDTSIKYNGYNTIKTTVGNGIVAPWYKLDNGVEYTYSMMVRCNEAFTGTTNVPLHYWAGANNSSQGKISVIKADVSYPTANVWKLIYITFKLTGDADSFRPFVWWGSGSRVFNIAYLKLEKGNKPTDWTPAPEDVDSAISTVDTKITTTNNKVASIETNLNGITQRVSSTESTISTHTSQLSTVDSRINTAKNSAISTASSDATSKANNAQTNAVNSAKSYTDGQITTVNKTITDKVAEIKTTTDSITQRVSNTESTLVTTTTTANTALNNTNNTWSKNYAVNTATILPIKEFNGTDNLNPKYWYEVEGFIDGTGTNNGALIVFKGNGTVFEREVIFEKGLSSNHVKLFLDNGVPSVTLYNHKSKYTVTCRVKRVPRNVSTTSSLQSTKNQVASIETNLSSITSRVSSTEDNITTINGNITNLTSRMNSAEQKITPSAIVSTVQSTINTAKTEAINSANSATDKKLQNYATKASMELTASQLRLSFSESGGNNLLLNSAFLHKNGWDHWWLHTYNNPSGGSIAVINSSYGWGFPDLKVNTLQLRLSNTSNVEYGVGQTVKTIPGKKYTLSFYYAGHRISGAHVIIRNGAGGWLADKGFEPQAYRGSNKNINGWGHLSLTFVAEQTSHNINIVISNAQNDGYLWIAKPMVNEGDAILPWTKNAEELINGSTIIDGDGVIVNNGALTIKNKAGSTVFQGDTNGNLVFTGIAKSQNGSQWVGLDSGGLLFQDWNRKEQMLRMGISYFDSNRDMNGITFAMPKYSDHIRFAYIDKTDLTNGWSSSDSQYNFMDFWSGTYTVGGINYKKGINVYAPMYVNNGIFMKSGANHTSDIKGDIIWNTINGLLGLTGDNGCFVGYKNGDSLQARMVLTEGAHPGTGDNIISWGHYNFNGYTFHNAKVNALSLSVSGSKNCLQKTENYGNRLINAYETAEYYFGDLGFGRINPDGECLVSIDDIFQECVNTKIDYHVFTQCYNGSIESIEKYETYFIVKGKPKTEFSWELKAKRISYENNRLDTEEIAQTFISDYESEIDTYKVDTSEDALLGDIMFDLELILMGE